MKKFFLIVAVFSGFITTTGFKSSNLVKTKIIRINSSSFCEGWKDGYCEGWKDVKGTYAICPITPICPIPEIGQDSYKGGYNRGFKAGTKAAQ